MSRAGAGVATLLAALLSVFPTASGAVAPDATPAPASPGSSARSAPAHPPVGLAPPRDWGELRAPNSLGTLAQDREFAQRIRRVYQDGIDAADMEIANGRSTRLKAMARRVAAANRREMAELDKWIARQKLRVTRASPVP